MEKKKIKAENKLSVGGITLVPVVENGSLGWQIGESINFIGYKRPLAVIVVSAGLKKAYRITGEELTFDEFLKEFPSVKAEIDSL